MFRSLRVFEMCISLLILLRSPTTFATDGVESGGITTTYDETSIDQLVIACFSLLFAFCLCTITSVVAYCVYTEDRIFRSYLFDGIRVEAKVVEYSLIRTVSFRQSEYSVTIDYKYISDSERDDDDKNNNKNDVEDQQSENHFATIVRKQIKCLESDFICRSNTECYRNEALGIQRNDIEKLDRNGISTVSPTKRNTNFSPRRSLRIEVQRDAMSSNDLSQEKYLSFDVAVFVPPKQYYIDVVVLMGYPGSAIGYQHILRSMMHSPIAILIIFLTIASYFCMFVGLLKIGYSKYTLALSGVLVGVILLFETLMLHTCFYETIYDMLSREYIQSDSDECYDYKTEDETLYTMPSSFADVTSTSWKNSSPNLSSLYNVKQGSSSNKLYGMEDLTLGG